MNRTYFVLTRKDSDRWQIEAVCTDRRAAEEIASRLYNPHPDNFCEALVATKTEMQKYYSNLFKNFIKSNQTC